MDILINIIVGCSIIGILSFWYISVKSKKGELFNLSRRLDEIREQSKRAESDYANLIDRIVYYSKQEDTLRYELSTLEDKISDKEFIYKTIEERNNQFKNLCSQEQLKLENNIEEYRQFCESKKTELKLDLSKIESSIKALNHIYILENSEIDKLNMNRLNINDSDINDVLLLQNIKLKFSNPRVISKLIWQTYYQPIAKVKFSDILENRTVTGIYKITNIKNNKIYIGQAVDIYKRWCDHCKCGCGLDTPANNKLYKAMQEDGLYNFRFELLEECPREQLNEKEKYYIELYETIIYGYNSQGGISG